MILVPGGLTTFTIPNTVKVIGANAFKNSSIEKITIPDGVKSIGSDGFSYCEKVTYIYVPESVEFIGHQFDCVDEGFGEDTEVDVVVRPEDIYIMNKIEGAQFTGKVKSCTFKGVHYEMYVDSDKGYEMMVQDYNAFEPGSEVGLLIRPADIQVMHKERTCNTFDAEIVDATHVKLLGETFEYEGLNQFEPGTKVKAQVAFSKVDLIDHPEEGTLSGLVHFLIYKGDHYHLTILTDEGYHIWVDTNDIWDKGDLVGINIAPKDIKIIKTDE